MVKTKDKKSLIKSLNGKTKHIVNARIVHKISWFYDAVFSIKPYLDSRISNYNTQ